MRNRKPFGSLEARFPCLPGPAVLGLLTAVLAFLAVCSPAFPFCRVCHDKDFTPENWKSVHEPFEDDCLACHEEHRGAGRLALVESGNELCFMCHDADSSGYAKAHFDLPVERLECVVCHDPHGSGKAKLLRDAVHRPMAFGACEDCHLRGGGLRAKTTRLLCFRCHDAASFTGASVHEPVAEGDCGECHDPHATPFPALLTLPYTNTRFVSFSEKAYGICFECHDAAPFLVAEGGETGFGDGNANYHFLHSVNRRITATGNVVKEGITCRNCHLPHASPRLRLVREELDCGGVPCLRLNFTVENGIATCAAGCHKPYSYPSGPQPEVAVERSGLPVEEKVGDTANAPACISCHTSEWESYRAQNVVHEPLAGGECGDCHLDHGATEALLLKGQGEDLCAACHGLSGLVESHAGYDVAGSDCLRCHDPHAAGGRGLLPPLAHDPFAYRSCDVCHKDGTWRWDMDQSVNDACANCHEQQFEHKQLHGAITRRSCTGCHDPHASRFGRLLVAENPVLCYACHDQKRFRQTMQHEPVSDGDCAGCHDVHGSDFGALLLEAYPLEQQGDFTVEAYALCFSCHSEGPFQDAGSLETSFRQGDANLHFLHVNTTRAETGLGRKTIVGYSCRNCHEPHSTGQPNLVREALDCGGVPCLKLDFQKSADGTGWCTRGCHRPKDYNSR